MRQLEARQMAEQRAVRVQSPFGCRRRTRRVDDECWRISASLRRRASVLAAATSSSSATVPAGAVRVPTTITCAPTSAAIDSTESRKRCADDDSASIAVFDSVADGVGAE